MFGLDKPIREPTSGLEPLTCSQRVSGSYCTSNPLRSISLVIGLSIGLFSRSRSALAENPFYRIPGSSGYRPRSLRSRWPASPSRACPKGIRGAFLPHGGDSKPRHCWCVWCTALLVVPGGPIGFFEQTGCFDGVPGGCAATGRYTRPIPAGGRPHVPTDALPNRSVRFQGRRIRCRSPRSTWHGT